MAKKCPDCGFSNEDSRIFCGSCGEPLGGDEKLVRDMEKMKKQHEEDAKNPKPVQDKPLEGKKPKDEDYVAPVKKQDDTAVNLGLIFLGVIAVALLVVVGWYFLTQA